MEQSQDHLLWYQNFWTLEFRCRRVRLLFILGLLEAEVGMLSVNNIKKFWCYVLVKWVGR